MVSRIEKGEADGILAWHPDRLSRNSVDAGRLIHLLDTSTLKDLKFACYTFTNTPEGKLMLSTVLGFSKYYSDALSENVKRGQRARLKNGWHPNLAPLGYLNCKNTETIIPDPERFDLVKQMWGLMLTGSYTPNMIQKIADQEWGLRSIKKKRRGGCPVALSTIYAMFRNPFYTGVIPWQGRIYDGKHEPIVSISEFETVQNILGKRKQKPHTSKSKLKFTYSGMIRCGECHCTITAERKTNRFGSHYTYYRCTHRKSNYDCRQKSIEVKNLEAQIVNFLKTLTISEEIFDLLVEEAERLRKNDTGQKDQKVLSLKREIANTDKKYENLNQLRINDLISNNEYAKERQKLEFNERKLRQNLEKLETTGSWFAPFKNFLELRKQAIVWFKNGDEETKRLILNSVGSHPEIIDKKLLVQAKKPFSTIPNQTNIPVLREGIKDFRKWDGNCQSSPFYLSLQEIRKRASPGR